MKQRPYPKYRASGIEWLGNIPDHWETKKLKYVASLNDDVLPETTAADRALVYVDIGNVDSREGIVATEDLIFEAAPSRARRLVRDGDTIVSTVRTYLRAIAPIESPSESLVVSTGFAVVRPRQIEPRYLSYALREKGFVDEVVARSVGVSYPGTNPSEIEGIPISLPSVAEQTAISEYLDRLTTRIDRLIAKKRKLIDRLHESRVTLITHVVTRGLSAQGVRESGAAWCKASHPSERHWLRYMPSHWQSIRFRRLIERLEQGTSPVAATWPAEVGEWGVLKLSAARLGRFIPIENKALGCGDNLRIPLGRQF